MPPRADAPALPVLLVVLLVALIGIEGALQAADHGWIGTLRWRSLAYQYGAFWPGLLENWTPNFAGQPATMFVTYAFLHGGLEHLSGNVLTLWVLGRAICDRTGQRGFVAIYALTSLGGALCYAALSAGTMPMVGASGALFGLAGIMTGWRLRNHPDNWRSLTEVLAICLGLVALNVALIWWHSGDVAWQTHLGGFVTGFALAGWLGRNHVRLQE